MASRSITSPHADARVLGYFYADFFPRAGKYGHAAAFPLISGRALEGGYSQPVASIVANFNPPADGKPWARVDGTVAATGASHARRDPLRAAGPGHGTAAGGLAMQAFWTGVGILVFSLAWRRAIRQYSAVAG